MSIEAPAQAVMSKQEIANGDASPEHLAELYKSDAVITTIPPKGPCRAHAILTKAGLEPTDPAAWGLLIDRGYSFNVERDGTVNLADLERVIERGLAMFIEVGDALAQIRDRKLYRDTHDTFEAYCEERWGLKRTRAYELMQAAGVARLVSEISDTKITRESHAKALAKLRDKPAQLRKALVEVNAQEAGTAKHIVSIVRTLDPPAKTERGEPDDASEVVDGEVVDDDSEHVQAQFERIERLWAELKDGLRDHGGWNDTLQGRWRENVTGRLRELADAVERFPGGTTP